jgi:formylglycine-generating enzyme required for sulfatase activity
VSTKVILPHYSTYLRNVPATADPQNRTLTAFISRYLIEKQNSFELPTDFFQRLMHEGQAVILLLDGLDEVPDEADRVSVREDIEELLTGRDWIQAVVTCRTAAYKDRTALGRDFREIQVKPLEGPHIQALVRQAYAAIYRHDPVMQRTKTDELLRGIDNLEGERRRRLGENAERLISSPLLVRMLLVVHFSERRLPEQRAELYMKATDAMLLPDYSTDEEVADRIGRLVGGSRELHRDLVQHLAFAMHSRGDTKGHEIDEQDLRKVLSSHRSYASLADDFIALSRLRGTLLEERLGTYRFVHLAFQEYLAARYLAEIRRGENGVEGIAAFLETGPILDTWWREPSLLVCGYLSITSPQTAETFLNRLIGIDDRVGRSNSRLSPELQMAAAEVAATALLEWQGSRADLRNGVADRIVHLFGNPDLMHQIRPSLRAAAGDALGRLDDLRFRSDAWYLPDEPLLGFVEIPAGSFRMGSDKKHDKQAYDDELPQHDLTLRAYYIARWPVTVAQFRAFVDDAGYRGCKPEFSNSLSGLHNHPVVNVSWHDAMRYCDWLTEKLRAWEGTPEPLSALLRPGKKGGPTWQITLPSEAEWEKAARGTDARIYPWGKEPDPNRANYGHTGIRSTSSVGCFSNGASPYGVEDLSGNVSEWTRSVWDRNIGELKFMYPYDPNDGRENLGVETVVRLVLRGGAFDGFGKLVRCADRYRRAPDVMLYNIGFRVVMSPI